MEESDTVLIFRPGEKSRQKRRPGRSLRAIFAFLPLVFLLALSFYVWQWEAVSTAEKGSVIELQEEGADSFRPDAALKQRDRHEMKVETEMTDVERDEPGMRSAAGLENRAGEVVDDALNPVLEGEPPAVKEPASVVPVKEASPAEDLGLIEEPPPGGEPVLAEDNILVLGEQVYRYTASFEVSATAYCPGTPESGCPIDERGASQCTGFYNDGLTATGVPAVPGEGSLEHPHLVAVDPALIPLKSLLYMEGLGFARAEDTGAAIKGESLDLLFGKHDEAWRFGRQKLKIYVLDPHFAPYFR